MCETNDGFKIAEKDLEMRGPGDIEGTRQSGVLDFKLANIVQDKQILEEAREIAERIINNDPELNLPENFRLKIFFNCKKVKLHGVKFREMLN